MRPFYRIYNALFGVLILLTLMPVICRVSAAADSEVLSRADYWRSKAPWCVNPQFAPKYKGLKFASKYQDGIGTDTEDRRCNDGNSIVFNGLLCLAGLDAQPILEAQRKPGEQTDKGEAGCAVVEHSQSGDGRWWRSPARPYSDLKKEESETTFSNDHALGVIAYLVQSKNVGAFRNWMKYISSIGPCASLKCLVGLPRYCPDDRCGFKLIDCPLLDLLANYLGEKETVCPPAPEYH